jgi:hypothetical protein
MKRFIGALAFALALGIVQNGILVNTAHASNLRDSEAMSTALRMSGQAISSVRVSGKVTLSPVCPVEHNPPDPSCAPKPYKTTLQIKYMADGTFYRAVATNTKGAFALALAPGRYILQVKKGINSSIYPRCADLEFIVTPKKPLHLEMSCDTGIR